MEGKYGKIMRSKISYMSTNDYLVIVYSTTNPPTIGIWGLPFFVKQVTIGHTVKTQTTSCQKQDATSNILGRTYISFGMICIARILIMTPPRSFTLLLLYLSPTYPTRGN